MKRGWEKAVLGAVAFTSGAALASQVTIGNAVLRERDATTAWVEFDVSWDKSWRRAAGDDPLYYHDAVWLFFKLQSGATAAWQHLHLVGSGVNPDGYAVGSGTPLELVVPDDRVGVLLRRTAEGSGPVAAERVRLVCDLEASGIQQVAGTSLRGFALEMVYVARGSFKVGSGGNGDGELCEGGGGKRPFLVSGEGAIEFGDEPGKLWGPSDSGRNSMGGAGRLPAAFPKGYAPFYCMKYEISQGDYCGFLNTLTREQQTQRATPHEVGRYMWSHEGGSESPLFRNSVQLSVDPGEPSARQYTVSRPGVACNWLSWLDVAAFSAWAALRPMTELEYEKACRGPADPVADEYAWGNCKIMPLSNMSCDAYKRIKLLPPEANCCVSKLTEGPLEGGLFERPGAAREATGASFWGILDLSGNVWERVITVGHELGRCYSGRHGDGQLTPEGEAAVADWPDKRGAGGGFRGSNWFDCCGFARVSDRYWSAIPSIDRKHSHGGRAVRTAP